MGKSANQRMWQRDSHGKKNGEISTLNNVKHGLRKNLIKGGDQPKRDSTNGDKWVICDKHVHDYTCENNEST